MQKICIIILSKRTMHSELMAEENEILTLGSYITTANILEIARIYIRTIHFIQLKTSKGKTRRWVSE